MAITKLDSNPKLFEGQGDLVIFSEISDYTNKTLAALVSPTSLGQIVQDSTTWEGEDVSTDQILDEQGNVITAHVTAGTLGFSFDIASTSKTMITTFLKGAAIETPGNLDLFGSTAEAVGDVTGFGVDVPVITRPIAVLNSEKNRAWIYPKAKITANLALADGLYRIHAVVVAEQVDQPKLKTAMVVEKAVSNG